MKKLLFTLTVFIAALNGHAQIIYHDISPDTTVNTWNAWAFAPNPVLPAGITLWYHPVPEVVVVTDGDLEILFSGAYPAKLNAGDSISPSGTWHTTSYDALNSSGTGNWQTASADKYLGFRFKDPTSWKYGWLKMTVAPGAASFTVKDWAYNTQANKTINAGQNATTGIAGFDSDRSITMSVINKDLRFNGLESGIRYPISILDMNGRTVQKNSITSNESLSMNTLSNGIYIIQLNVGGYCHSFRCPVL